MLIQLPWAVSTLSHPRLIKQIEKHSSLHHGFKNSLFVKDHSGRHKQSAGQGTYPCPNCNGPRALAGDWQSLGTAAGRALPLCCCHGSATAAASLLVMPFIYILLIYFRSWKCILNISVKPGVMEEQLEEKGLRMQSGDRDGEHWLAPPRPTPLPDSHHLHNTLPLTHANEML